MSKRSSNTTARRRRRTSIARCSSAPGSKRALQRKAWIIQRALHGHDLDGKLPHVDALFRGFIRRLTKVADKSACYQRYLETLGQEEKDVLAKAVEATSPAAPDPDAVATGADLVRELPKVAWMWIGWIPKGMVTMLVALPGMGKSAFVLYGIVLAIVLGRPWPDGQRGPKTRGKVLWVDTEGTQGITRDRIVAWGVPPELILFPTSDWKDDLQLDLNQVNPSR